MSDSAPSSGLADTSLLDKIDKLFACGVGDLIDLPQIVVVGDQSSGKSSVLEGLVRREFPRDSGLCTRFATQLVFRRSNEERISVSIIPDPNAAPDQTTKLEQWGYTDMVSLDSAAFGKIMKEVHDILGLAGPGELDSGKPTFSDSVLRLEITGPSQEHLSVIDVPGIFKKSTAGLTTKADISLVKDMVLEYMENPRTVMLVVVPANVDAATQEILEMATDVDPEGDRTLGVLTKPDLVDKGAEHNVLDMIEGRTVTLQLGWHVVRNPGQKDLNDPATNRDRLETAFFHTTAPWNKVEPHKTGVEALRGRLMHVLSDLVKREFPKVKTEISKRLVLNEKQLGEIGHERSSSSSQATYLIDLSVKFQSLMTRCVDGKSACDSTFDQLPNLRLATAVSARLEKFSRDLANHGHTYVFGKTKAESTSSSQSNPATNASSVKDSGQAQLSVCATREIDDIEELLDVLQPSEKVTFRDADTFDWLKKTYIQCRGFELGSFDPAILGRIMRQQSENWSGISLGFTSDVVVLVHRCIVTAIEHITPHKSLRASLLNALLDGLIYRYTQAIHQTQFLLCVERDGMPLTANHYFNDNLQKSRQERVTQQMKAVAHHDNLQGGLVVRLDQAIKTHPMNNAQHTVQDIHDILWSYYKVARKRFTDNVIAQSVAYHLLTGPETPLKLFSTSFVANLTPEELQHIAGEAPSLSRKRARLVKEIASLKEARLIISKG